MANERNRPQCNTQASANCASPQAADPPLIEGIADRLLTLAHIAALVPGRGRNRVHAGTVARWIVRGVRTPEGRRVRLRAVRLASKWLTTRAWLDQFAAAQTPSFTDGAEPVPTDRQRDRAADEAGRRLARMGA